MTNEEAEILHRIVSQKRPKYWGSSDETLYVDYFPVAMRHAHSEYQEARLIDGFVGEFERAKCDQYKIMRFSCWALGWREELFVHKDSKCAKLAAKRIARRLEHEAN
jgi:hypothetical protein